VAHLRVARPPDDLEPLARLYAEGLGLGFTPVKSWNPYWDDRGRSFEDPDGYRVVIQNAVAPGEEAPDI
jgi:hypothetical protein